MFGAEDGKRMEEQAGLGVMRLSSRPVVVTGATSFSTADMARGSVCLATRLWGPMPAIVKTVDLVRRLPPKGAWLREPRDDSVLGVMFRSNRNR